MPLSNIIILCGIVGAFALFGIALAWAEHRTRNFKRPDVEPEAQHPPEQPKQAA